MKSREKYPDFRSTPLPIYEVFNKLKLPPEVGRARSIQVLQQLFHQIRKSRNTGAAKIAAGIFHR